jgi:hypothetical protein
MPFIRAQDAFDGVIRRAGGDATATKDAVAELVGWMLRRSRRSGTALLTAISSLADAAARAAVATGGGMGWVAHGYLLGVMLASERRESELFAVLGHAAGTLVRHACAAGADTAAAARGAVAGAVEWARRERFDERASADAAGVGAAEAADDIDAWMSHRVRAALSSPVSGVPITLKAPATTGHG